MNLKKWRNPKVPLPVLALKLSEEAAEVGTEITDAYMEDRPIHLGVALAELRHVEAFCEILRHRLIEQGMERRVDKSA